MTDVASWTDERVEALARLWSDGLSASQIAAQLGGVTRNAVIGKVHRLGLSGRNKAAALPQAQKARKPARPTGPAPAPAMPAASFGAPQPVATLEPPAAEQELSDDVVIPFSERVTIMELRESMCRWPLGDPTTPEFRFCGQRSPAGVPYCSHHARVAYQPAADRKRGDRRMAMRA
jgi:GcrA cell cycle regulator